MPTTRRSAARSAGKQQSTLSFNHRVTKPVPQSTKSAAAKSLTAAAAAATTPTKQSPLGKHVLKVEDEDDVAVEEEEEGEPLKQEEALEKEEEKSEAELRAQKVSQRQIDQYWRGLERERTTRRVHQQDLSLAEKVLRYWDVSSQYGPCVGISRMKRWQRADRLGLNPPVEVLAVLIKEGGKSTEGTERAHIDAILNSTSTSSAAVS